MLAFTGGVQHVVQADAAPRMAPQTPIVTSVLTCLSFPKARTAEGSAHLCATAGGGMGLSSISGPQPRLVDTAPPALPRSASRAGVPFRRWPTFFTNSGESPCQSLPFTGRRAPRRRFKCLGSALPGIGILLKASLKVAPSIIRMGLPRFRGRVRAWDYYICLDGMLSSKFETFFGLALRRSHSSVPAGAVVRRSGAAAVKDGRSSRPTATSPCTLTRRADSGRIGPAFENISRA
jgi:hypothetical protein